MNNKRLRMIMLCSFCAANLYTWFGDLIGNFNQYGWIKNSVDFLYGIVLFLSLMGMVLFVVSAIAALVYNVKCLFGNKQKKS